VFGYELSVIGGNAFFAIRSGDIDITQRILGLLG